MFWLKSGIVGLYYYYVVIIIITIVITNLMAVKWYPIEILSEIFLIIKDIDHFLQVYGKGMIFLL